MSENRFKNYVPYALGEIALVVIGILIALAINNASLRNKDRTTALTHLKSLHEEFLFNLQLLETTIEQGERLAEAAERFRIYFDPAVQDTLSENHLTSVFGGLNGETVYNPSSGALREVISSGNLKLLENADLKLKLAGFEQRILRVRVQEDESLKLRTDLGYMVRQEGSISSLMSLNAKAKSGKSLFQNTSNKHLLKSAFFQNTILFYGGVQASANSTYYEPLKEDILEIIRLIEEEIKKMS